MAKEITLTEVGGMLSHIVEHMATKEDLNELREGLSERIDGAEDRFDNRIDGLEKRVDEGFARIDRRLDTVVQTQLDAHAGRIKKLEMATFK